MEDKQNPKKQKTEHPQSSSNDNKDTEMTKLAEGVEFDTIAREWRCKWSPDNDKKSLVELQKVLNEHIEDIKKVDGVKEVKRIICGNCMDFKVITALTQEKFGDWEKEQFAPEEKFLEKIKKIDGVSMVETQTYTFMTII
mmetsp:Transcript_5738/g.9051  ORF Transcript_5738/g.9051 Transcript_5738/m.9051 type:complete len:140 (+) Transcript_5738:176-595(+)|eukprot:CAMPEP_0178881608 /NCGR_PEP_ID=MMETSP0747-20121128/13088_1 /TAXON_ID=913974 /ORGANISM="Nitzschia punctata, Strain CCMP561" /LENGTH=139 /DNA_ID=CAMNT_0020549581 /DNA_START=264 /DNA_END=683 /DNA_ORIENTATION=+